ncbi:hypothetical protein MHYP_G00124390 [Metynnis hypsauchen]
MTACTVGKDQPPLKCGMSGFGVFGCVEWSSETCSGLPLTLSQPRATQQEQWRVFPVETKAVTLESSLTDYKKEWSRVKASGRLGRSTKHRKHKASFGIS